jgi:integrase
MSVERVRRPSGDVWRVRWREAGRSRSRVLGRKSDAIAFDAEIKRRKRLGELATFDGGRQTVADFAEEWWRLYAAANLVEHTLRSYAWMWDRHVHPRLGGARLSELTPGRLEAFRRSLEADGVGAASTRRVLVILQSVLQRAVEWERIPTNPVRLVRKPPARRSRAVRPIPPEQVEQMRERLVREGAHRDATLLVVLAYAGLRPGEALALTWGCVGKRSLVIDGAIALGKRKPTKTDRMRSVTLLPPLAADLRAWQLACGRPGDDALVFAGHDGQPWSDTAWRNWRRRIFQPLATDIGLADATPYDLRHSFCSLLIEEGRSVVEVARQAGHAPTMTLDTYGHVFDEADPADRVPAEQRIRQARERYATERVSEMCPPTPSANSAADENACKSEEPTRGLEPRTPSLRVMCSTS